MALAILTHYSYAIRTQPECYTSFRFQGSSFKVQGSKGIHKEYYRNTKGVLLHLCELYGRSC